MKHFNPLFPAILAMAFIFSLTSCRTKSLTIADQTDIHEYELWQQRVDAVKAYSDSLLHAIAIRDSLSALHERIDSTYHRTFQSDTLMTRDSISVTVLGDGSTITDRYHWQTRILTLHDTLHVLDTRKDYLYELQQEQAYTDHLTAVNIQLHEEIDHLRDSLSHQSHEQETVTTTNTPFKYKLMVCLILMLASWLLYRLFDRNC